MKLLAGKSCSGMLIHLHESKHIIFPKCSSTNSNEFRFSRFAENREIREIKDVVHKRGVDEDWLFLIHLGRALTRGYYREKESNVQIKVKG